MWILETLKKAGAGLLTLFGLRAREPVVPYDWVFIREWGIWYIDVHLDAGRINGDYGSTYRAKLAERPINGRRARALRRMDPPMWGILTSLFDLAQEPANYTDAEYREYLARWREVLARDLGPDEVSAEFLRIEREINSR